MDVPGLAIYTRILRTESKTPRLMAERFVEECIAPVRLCGKVAMRHLRGELVRLIEDAFDKGMPEVTASGAESLMAAAVRAVRAAVDVAGLDAVCEALAAAGLDRMRGVPSTTRRPDPEAWRQLHAWYESYGLWPTPAVVWNAPAYIAVAEAAGEEADVPAGVRIEDGVDIDERLEAQYGARHPPAVVRACARGIAPGGAAVLLAAFRR